MPLKSSAQPMTWYRILVLTVSLAVVACAIVTMYHVLKPPPPVADDDYDPLVRTLCYFAGLADGPPASYPPESLAPLGQPFDGRTIRFEVTQTAETKTTIAKQHAHGVYLVVSVSLQYIGLTKNGSTMSPQYFQLADREGGINCIIQRPTNNANPDTLPYSFPPPTWSVRLSPGAPPITITLVFDIDRSLVAGAYLRAVDPGGARLYNFSLGLG